MSRVAWNFGDGPDQQLLLVMPLGCDYVGDLSAERPAPTLASEEAIGSVELLGRLELAPAQNHLAIPLALGVGRVVPADLFV